MTSTQSRREYGDFQTPETLANECVAKLRELGIEPKAIVEPTCGVGAFLAAAVCGLEPAERAFGLEVEPEYAARARARLSSVAHVEVATADFFSFPWDEEIARLPKPILVVGNPPWVTSAELGTLGSANLPTKSPRPGHRGIESVTGKANFDISEWMIYRNLEWLTSPGDALAVLCKAAVARKVLANIWKHENRFGMAHMYLVDAKRHFNAAVDACLLVLRVGGTEGAASECQVFASLADDRPARTIGWRAGRLVSDAAAFDRNVEWLAAPGRVDWRSGIKHDAAAVMELRSTGEGLVNGLGQPVAIEGDLVYPMLKSSDVHRGDSRAPRWMLVTQRAVGDATDWIRSDLPLTWGYLEQHRHLLDGRRSTIYARAPRFAIFGVGPYSFAPWKLAISALHKDLNFAVVGPRGGRPVVFDDAVNILAAPGEDTAAGLLRTIQSHEAMELLSALIFWDNKRPVSVEVLRLLDVWALGQRLGLLGSNPALPGASPQAPLPLQFDVSAR
jgi:hypothetical protein